MSATMTMTVSETSHSISCPNCGTGLPSDIALDAQRQIEDLQTQIQLLTEKATAAVDKWADYEDEIKRLRENNAEANGPSNDSTARVPTPTNVPIQNRLSSFLTARRSTTNLQLPPSPSTPTSSERDLAAALSREQTLRQQAEGKLDEASGELEELSAQLFQQANEMVATERKARAKLEERVEVLERRDVEKRTRLERLEGAMGRIDRVRGLLAPGGN